MYIKPTNLIPFIFSTSLVIAQEKFSISESVNEFAINLLGATNNEAGDSLNIALSPYTVWTLMTILSEGALENTARQLNSVLKISDNKVLVRNYFRNLSEILLTKSDGVSLELSNAMFTNKDFPVKEQFSTISKQYYDVNVTPLNFKNTKEAVQRINKYVAQATKNRITTLVDQNDIRNAQIFLTSVLYLKGQWKIPFNKTATHRETFFDEKKNKIGEVNMMYQVGTFPYLRNEHLKSHAVELPYGNDRKMSMIVILPFNGESVTSVLNLMSRAPFNAVLKSLENAEMKFVDEEVNIYLPKFSVSSDFNLNVVLDKMGIKDVFNSEKANLLGIFPHYLYLSRLIQKAQIDVDEEGTVAAAAAGASIINKTPPPIFRANKPFIYLIVDKPTRSILFAGKITNPSTIGS